MLYLWWCWNASVLVPSCHAMLYGVGVNTVITYLRDAHLEQLFWHCVIYFHKYFQISSFYFPSHLAFESSRDGNCDRFLFSLPSHLHRHIWTWCSFFYYSNADDVADDDDDERKNEWVSCWKKLKAKFFITGSRGFCNAEVVEQKVVVCAWTKTKQWFSVFVGYCLNFFPICVAWPLAYHSHHNHHHVRDWECEYLCLFCMFMYLVDW